MNMNHEVMRWAKYSLKFHIRVVQIDGGESQIDAIDTRTYGNMCQ